MTADDEVQRVRRAFNAAVTRMLAGAEQSVAEDELSNALSQIYRLGELCRSTLGDGEFRRQMVRTDDLRRARAVLWARTFDTHELVVVGRIGGGYSDGYAGGYWNVMWRDVSAISAAPDKYGRDQDYVRLLEGRPVFETIRAAFDALAQLV